MNKQAYMLHLRELLETQYENVKNNPSKAIAKNERIEGYMEAGLISSMVTRNELKQVINDAHEAVYGVVFDERDKPSRENEDLIDIPTWVRRGLILEESSEEGSFLPIKSIDELYIASLHSEKFAKELYHSHNSGIIYTRLRSMCHKINRVLEHLVICDAETRGEDVRKALDDAKLNLRE